MYLSFFLEEALIRPKPEPDSSDEQPQEKPSEEPEQCQWPRRTEKKYSCPTCGKVFPRAGALKRHLVIHSGKRPFKCFICGRGFTQCGNLKTHMKVHKGQRQQEAHLSLWKGCALFVRKILIYIFLVCSQIKSMRSYLVISQCVKCCILSLYQRL